MIINNFHSSWNDYFTPQILEEIRRIEEKIGQNYAPDKDKVLRFSKMDLDKIQVCILGLDPYNKPGVATGRSFEVGNISNWNDKFKEKSLQNILRLIHKTYKNIDSYKEIKTLNQIREEINNSLFSILQPKELFDFWEQQGVLMLNTYLTVELNGQAKSHQIYWEDFSKKLINYISTKNPYINWFLWGKDAQSFKEFILNGKIFECRHPSRTSKSYKDDFLKSDCFKKTANLINWTGTND